MAHTSAASVQRLDVSAYRIPTPAPESDGTFEWDATTLVLAQATAGGVTGIGYTYADRSTAVFIEEHLRDVVIGADAMSPELTWDRMRHVIRNLGRPGVASMAIAAVDTALWDLKSRILDVPLAELLGLARGAVPAYGSGGFTSMSEHELVEQLGGWANDGLRMVKMKVGRDPRADRDRVRLARETLGGAVALFVDANGAYSVTEAIHQGNCFREHGVTWFEEPVSSDDLEGLAAVRRALGGEMDIAAGEYGYDLPYFQRMIDARAVDVLQVDVTRCAGITELVRVAALAAGRQVPLSFHTAPALHLHPALACPGVRHVEYFADHARIERMLFDGVPALKDGMLIPDLTRPGNGLSFRERDAARLSSRA
jgi:L-alanine-DL-glutamate epimerase-like enolase superfamily enzyme